MSQSTNVPRRASVGIPCLRSRRHGAASPRFHGFLGGYPRRLTVHELLARLGVRWNSPRAREMLRRSFFTPTISVELTKKVALVMTSEGSHDRNTREKKHGSVAPRNLVLDISWTGQLVELDWVVGGSIFGIDLVRYGGLVDVAKVWSSTLPCMSEVRRRILFGERCFAWLLRVLHPPTREIGDEWIESLVQIVIRNLVVGRGL